MQEPISQQDEFNKFIERMAKIRDLSSPPLYEFDDAEDYSKRLRKNFETIGKLAAENRKMLDEVLYPLLDPKAELSNDQVEEMSDFGEKLMNVANDEADFENLDIPIMALVADRLSEDAKNRDDICNLLRQMDAELMACYCLMNMTERISTHRALSEKYLTRGLEVGQFFINLLKKENLLTVPSMELRGLVLTDARFVSAFYEHVTNPELNQRNLDLLDLMRKVAEDPFYHNSVEDFDWDYFSFRVLQYYLQCTDNGNFRGFTKKQLDHIADMADSMDRFMEAHPDYVGSVFGAASIPFLNARNRFYAGRMEEAAYRRILLEAYEGRDPRSFGADGNMTNVLVPLEMMTLLDGKRTSRDRILLKNLYRNLSAYVFHMPNAGALSFVMEYYTGIIQRFYEVPSNVTFEDFGLQTLAALHPPTYVHSLMVGQLTECLCVHLLEVDPERLIGVLDTKTVEDVIAKKDAILHFAYHAAVCHDFGKIMIIDTILVYGRHLLDFEFDIIKSHPEVGYELLSQHESTRAYAEVARGHHRFYDDSRGYPEAFKTSESKVKTIIDLVMCADCMDAATDSVGRSYSRGKTLTEFVAEVEEGAGSRYAPWLLELLQRNDVQDDLRYLLANGRDETYRDTYLLLKGVKEKEN